MSNGHLEKVFSQIKLIKTNNRTSLPEITLDQLIRINVDGSPLQECEPKGSINQWLQDKLRHFNCRDDSEKPLPEPSDADPEN